MISYIEFSIIALQNPENSKYRKNLIDENYGELRNYRKGFPNNLGKS